MGRGIILITSYVAGGDTREENLKKANGRLD
jgi:hypothetical protein